MGNCEPTTEVGWSEVNMTLSLLRDPPEGMRVVKPGKVHGQTSAFLVDSSVSEFQEDGMYCMKLAPFAAEEVKRISRMPEGYRIAEEIPSPFTDRVVLNLNGCITGRVVSSLTMID